MLFCFHLFALTEAATLPSIVLRFSICIRPDGHMQLSSNCLRPFFVFVSSFFCFFGDVVFFEYFLSITVYLCMESTLYVFPFWMVFLYLVNTGWIFDIRLCENSINQSIIAIAERPDNLSVTISGPTRGKVSCGEILWLHTQTASSRPAELTQY